MFNQKAVIYSRTASTPTKRNKDNGLDAQEARCREFADLKGYQVEKVFRDEDFSGCTTNRPGLQKMINFLEKDEGGKHIVIIDDISRLARRLPDHLQLRTLIDEAGGKLESPSFSFGETPASQFMETTLKAVEQFTYEKSKVSHDAGKSS